LRVQIESCEIRSVSCIIFINWCDCVWMGALFLVNIIPDTLPLIWFNYFIESLSWVRVVFRFRFMIIKPYLILWGKQVQRSSASGTWQKVYSFMMIVGYIWILMPWWKLKICLDSLQWELVVIILSLYCGSRTFFESVSSLVLSWRKH
jgi:hypothetical protein